MQQYRITLWQNNKKYSYVMGTTDINDYLSTLKKLHDRVLVDKVENGMTNNKLR